MGPYLGVHGAPWVRQNRTLRILPFSSQICLPKLPKLRRDRLAVTPKPVCRGPSTRKSDGKPSIGPQGATQSLWDPTLGSTRHPGSGKIKNIPNFSLTRPKCPAKRVRRRALRFFATPKPVCGVPAGNQVLGCLLQCPRTPHNHCGAPPWVPQGTPGPAKLKITNFT